MERLSRRTLLASAALAAPALALGAVSPAQAASARSAPEAARLTWFSIANCLVEVGDTTILIDGYVTRVPGPPFFYGGGGGLAYTQAPMAPDQAAIKRVYEALNGKRIDYVLTSHSHFDHSFDTATWARLTSAPVIGSRTTAYQCIAQGVRADQCHIVSGGEVLDFGNGLTCRVIRTNHSGDNTNPEQHAPVELEAIPQVDPATGGLRAGVAEDFPNGGGGRAYLFTLDTRSGRRSWLYTSSLSAYDLRQPIVVDGVDYGAPLANITAAMADAGLDGVDLWLGVGSTAVAELVLPVVKPKTYLPNHWDGLYNPFFAGLPFPFSNPDLESMLAADGIALIPQRQYMDAFRLDVSGVTPVPNHAVKQKLGFSDVQEFAASAATVTQARRDAASHDRCCG
jgi:hypothetical protein